jgi:AcrR family transcriptional regulator
MVTETLGRREQHRRTTFESLRAAGLARFAAAGFENTTVQEIADVAGVSLRTFFRYFSCKEAILFGTDLHELALSFLRDRPADEPLRTSLHAIGLQLRELGSGDGDPRRELRRRLIRTHPSVRAYGRHLLMTSEPKVAELIAVRLGVRSADDLRPAAFAGLWTALLTFLFEHSGDERETSALAEQWLEAAAALLALPA